VAVGGFGHASARATWPAAGVAVAFVRAHREWPVICSEWCGATARCTARPTTWSLAWFVQAVLVAFRGFRGSQGWSSSSSSAVSPSPCERHLTTTVHLVVAISALRFRWRRVYRVDPRPLGADLAAMREGTGAAQPPACGSGRRPRAHRHAALGAPVAQGESLGSVRPRGRAAAVVQLLVLCSWRGASADTAWSPGSRSSPLPHVVGRDRFGRERTCRTGRGALTASLVARPAHGFDPPVPEWASLTTARPVSLQPPAEPLPAATRAERPTVQLRRRGLAARVRRRAGLGRR